MSMFDDDCEHNDIQDHLSSHHHKMKWNDEDSIWKELSHVYDNIWISSMDGAYNDYVWDRTGARIIINVSSIEPGLTEIIRAYSRKMIYKTISYIQPLHDKKFNWDVEGKMCHSSDSTDVNTFFKIMDITRDFIRNARGDSYSPVIVHCHEGINRSAAVICAYLIGELGKTSQEAIKLVAEANKKRDMPILTNIDFKNAIKGYAKYIQYKHDPTNRKYERAFTEMIKQIRSKSMP